MDRPLTRRTFCQLSLALACASAAGADPAPKLRGEFSPRLDGDKILVELRLYNDTDRPVDVLVARGITPAIELKARWGTWQALPQVVDDPDARLRSGPRRVWEPVPARASLVGRYTLVVPAGGRAALLTTTADFGATVWTHAGAVQISAAGLRVAAAP